jgi:uncharacterized damage-inducible protein DinB
LRRLGILSHKPSPTKSRVLLNVKPSTNDVPKGQATTMSDMSRDNAVGAAFIDRAVEYLLGHYGPKIERCLEKLTDEQIWWRPNEESNSIGNLVLHLCGNARQWIVTGLGSEPDTRVRDSEFAQRDVITRTELVTLLRTTLADVERVLRAVDPSTLLSHRQIQGHDVDVLEAIFHVTEHFSMHTGQIFLLTKLLTTTDLRFYDFEAGAPVERWHSGPSDSS